MELIIFVFVTGPLLLGAYQVIGDEAAKLAIGWVAVIAIWFVASILVRGVEPERSHARRERPERRMAQEDEYNLPTAAPAWSPANLAREDAIYRSLPPFGAAVSDPPPQPKWRGAQAPEHQSTRIVRDDMDGTLIVQRLPRSRQ